jgi:hypothetical protein
VDTVTIKGEKVAGQVVYIEIETTTPTRDNNASNPVPTFSTLFFVYWRSLSVNQ